MYITTKLTSPFVSHDMQSVVDFCDRAIWLKDGEIVSDGISKDVVSLYNSFVHQQMKVCRGLTSVS